MILALLSRLAGVLRGGGWNATSWLVFVCLSLFLFTPSEGSRQLRIFDIYGMVDDMFRSAVIDARSNRQSSEAKNALLNIRGVRPVSLTQEYMDDIASYARDFVDAVKADKQWNPLILKGATWEKIEGCVGDNFQAVARTAKERANKTSDPMGAYYAEIDRAAEGRRDKLMACALFKKLSPKTHSNFVSWAVDSFKDDYGQTGRNQKGGA